MYFFSLETDFLFSKNTLVVFSMSIKVLNSEFSIRMFYMCINRSDFFKLLSNGNNYL